MMQGGILMKPAYEGAIEPMILYRLYELARGARDGRKLHLWIFLVIFGEDFRQAYRCRGFHRAGRRGPLRVVASSMALRLSSIN